MIIQVDTPEYADSFASVYNSANTLFENSEQYAAAGQIFLPQLENDENFAYFEEKKLVGFMSFHCYGQYSELTSLYVRREAQSHGIGGQLMRHFEQQINVSVPALVNVLKSAPWALRFYQKHGFVSSGGERAELLNTLGLTEKPWEKILYKKPGV